MKHSIDDNNVKASDLKTRKDEDEHIEEGCVAIATDFFRLARKLNRYFKVTTTEFPIACEDDVIPSPIYSRKKKNVVRLPVLDYICPTSPVLDGYEPSENFKQTWCKGWKTLPIHQIRFIHDVLHKNQSNPLFLQLPVEIIVLFLGFLDGKSLAIISQVCILFWHIVKSLPVLRKRIFMAKEEHSKRRCIEKLENSLRMTARYSEYRQYRKHSLHMTGSRRRCSESDEYDEDWR